MHSLENHIHPICSSKVENHLHEKVIDCNFHFFKINQGYLPSNAYISLLPVKETGVIDTPYNFLLNHQPLSYRLRGPPAL